MTVDHVEMSPLQLVRLAYTGIHVEPFIHQDENGQELPPATEFGEVDIACRTGMQQLPEPKAERPEYVIEVGISISKEQVAEHRLPYVIDVSARGYFRLVGEVDADKRDSIVEINGASLVTGALRELVADLTARCPYGTMTLPTLRFVPAAE
ncbi:protein-export chaperone SecB [Halorhodospira halochloris]|uniref:protein-export chaperone SecB n=1 Tax=Halorhodospira TaxID=85108 RepID=UPI001EE89FB7|nr:MULTISPECIES: protein-export chaperone SecB [Halorhodospira]MCG5528834.1 protein-export chaperone SecB [Halorhodospira halophila]MCG5531625.1 protein-export chaperone SecB [Halorhodospira halochloris]MCG5544220.1 protein-export chaperone SecB [Halorhodospira sp. 9628]MCG5548907.1 protein-export chaperone SecB [Halorhodospira halochloris]